METDLVLYWGLGVLYSLRGLSLLRRVCDVLPVYAYW